MIDKLDLRVPRKAQFTPAFARLYAELQAMQRGPFRTAKHYEYAGDLREYGHQLRLNLYCRMDKAGHHKVELIDVGTMTRSQIEREVTSIFDVNPLSLGIMRIDLAVDVPDVPLAWFRQAVRAERKRFRSGIGGASYYNELGRSGIQTIYFGARPNVIRIYDKRAEYDHHYRMLIRKHSKNGPQPSFESIMGFSCRAGEVTRVERQFGGRIPHELQTFRNVCAERFEYEPFAGLRILNHPSIPERDSQDSFETYCTGMYLHSIAVNEGMQAVSSFLSKHSNGNTAWARRKYERFLPSATSTTGITSATLHERFLASLQRQMSR